MNLEELERRAGFEFLAYQKHTFEEHAGDPGPRQRLCLYYRTGAGKTVTSLALLLLWGCTAATVVAPPSTHGSWQEWADQMGVDVVLMSHAKFRQKDTKLDRTRAIIADEMHMFGRNTGKGWKKLEQAARGLDAPLIMASATPNYNDAERVYCIQRILDPLSCRGGFLEFLYKNCETEADPFSMTPKVVGFRNYVDAANYLAALPGVAYLPDDLTYRIVDRNVTAGTVPHEYVLFGYNPRKRKIMASQMEERHDLVDFQILDAGGVLRSSVADEIERAVEDDKPVLIFCNHATVAEGVAGWFMQEGQPHGLVTGKTSKDAKLETIERFKQGDFNILIGTSTLATGTDGLDKVCDQLLILDDTDDDSLRRQLIGRIMPRGIGGRLFSNKRIVRFVYV